MQINDCVALYYAIEREKEIIRRELKPNTPKSEPAKP